ncbi:MAG: MFS transporter [Nitrososphaerota archaeon]|nr:MFS transporter [Nitrososphaerota archaeon]MDG6921941.1 MFS transporter [Nitrososphaerota archaeon]
MVEIKENERNKNAVTMASVRRWVLILSIFGQFMVPFDGSVVNLAIKSIGVELGGSISTLSWIITGYLIVVATLNLVTGRLADIRGRKNTYVWGIVIFTIASALCGLAPSVDVLIITRMVQAVGGSFLAGNGIALLSTFYPQGERGRALGISTAALYTGLSAGPSLGGFLIQFFGWRSIFYVNVPIGIVVLLIALLKIRGELPMGKLERFDVRGAVIYGTAIFASLLGISYLGTLFDYALPILIFGLATLAAFVFLETRTEHPLLDLKLFVKNHHFTLTITTTFLNYASTYGIAYIMSLYLQLGLGYSPAYAGLILLAQPVLMVISSPFGGYLSDRVEPRYQTTAALALMCMAIIGLSTLNLNSTPADIVIRLIFLGLGYGFFSSANTNALVGAVQKAQYGVASGIQATMRNTGQAISLALVTYLLSTTLRENASSGSATLQSIPPSLLVSGVRITLIVLAIINGVGILTSLSRGKRTITAESQPSG